MFPRFCVLTPALCSGQKFNASLSVHAKKLSANKSFVQMYCWYSQPIWNETERMKKRLLSLGFSEYRVKADGNCQFRAIAYSLKKDEEQYHEIRENVVRWLMNNKNYHIDAEKTTRMQDFLETCDFPQWESYCNYMGRSGTWGDHLTLMAAAECFKVKISIISSVLGPDHQAETIIVPYSCLDNNEWKADQIRNHIYLSHWHEKHYNALVPFTEGTEESVTTAESP